MKERLITFETAKLAKEKGFTEICNDAYVSIGILEEGLKLGNKWERDYTFVTAPTQSLLQNWLWEIYKIWVSIDLDYNDGYFNFKIQRQNKKGKWYTAKRDNYTSLPPYESLELGLEVALKLIK